MTPEFDPKIGFGDPISEDYHAGQIAQMATDPEFAAYASTESGAQSQAIDLDYLAATGMVRYLTT